MSLDTTASTNETKGRKTKKRIETIVNGKSNKFLWDIIAEKIRDNREAAMKFDSMIASDRNSALEFYKSLPLERQEYVKYCCTCSKYFDSKDGRVKWKIN